MNADNVEERFSALLAACDDALATGSTALPVSADVPTELKDRLERDVAWCRLVRRLLPAGGRTPQSSQAQPTPQVSSAPVSLTTLGRFQIRRELGRGGCGVVFLAHDPELGREVALKIPRPEVIVHTELRARFAQEARVAASLDHPNLVPVYEAGAEGAICYIASAFCPGVTLSAWLKARTEPVPFETAARLVATLAEAVEHAHRRGILHRDLKPSNVMLSPRDPGQHAPLAPHDLEFVPRILDFGLAKLLEGDPDAGVLDYQTQSGAIVGTPSYMAPEQAGGDNTNIGPATDVHALGAILYETLTGRPPFRADSVVDTLLQVRTLEPASPVRLRFDVPRDLETICLKCLHKDPRKRYISAQALADDLHRFLTHQPIQARRVGVAGRTMLWCRRNPALTVTITLAVLTIAVVAGTGMYQVIQERNRFLQERDQARANLYRALTGEARALMQARDTGWWWKAMDNIRQAGALNVADRDPNELRELAIECMGTSFPCMRLHDTWTGHNGPITCTVFSPDGRRVASGGRDGTIRLWSVPDGKPLAVLSGHHQQVTDLAFHPAGKSIASSSADGSVRLWDDESGTAQVVELDAAAVNAVAWSPDGARLMAGCQNGTIHMLPLDRGKLADRASHRVLAEHSGSVTCLAFSPTGQLVSGSADKTIRFWDVNAAKQAKSWATVNVPSTLIFQPTAGVSLIWAEPESYGVYLGDLRTNAYYPNNQMHAGPIRKIDFERDGRFLLTASTDGTVKAWRNTRGNVFQEIAVGRGAPAEAHTLAINREGNWVAAGYANGQLRLWELAEPPQRAFLPVSEQRADFVGNEHVLVNGAHWYDFSGGMNSPPRKSYYVEPIEALVMHPAGRLFAFGDRQGALTIGDLEQPSTRVACDGHQQTITALAASLDGKHLASSSADGTIRLWKWETGTCECSLAPGLGALHGLAWCKDNQTLACTGQRGVAMVNLDAPGKFRLIREHSLLHSSTAVFGDLIAFSGAEGAVEVYEWSTSSKRHALRGHTATVTALAFSPDGKLLASAAADGSVRLWQMGTGDEWAVFTHSHKLIVGTWLAFDVSGRYLASNGQGTLIWDLRSKTPAALFIPAGNCGCFTVNDSALLVGTSENSVLKCTVAEIEAARMAAQGSAKSPPSTFVSVWPRELVVKGGHVLQTWGVAASPDGRWIATCSHDQTVKLWDAKTLKHVRTLEGHVSPVWFVAFSPDSKYVASGSEEKGSGTVILWEVATGRKYRHLRGHQHLVRSVAFHPHRPWLASCSSDGSVHLWDLDAGQSLGMIHQFDQAVHSVAFRPDGRCLAASCLDHRVALWDLTEPPSGPMPPTRLLEGHTGAVYAVAFSPDGRYLASGSEQGVVKLWDAQTSVLVDTLRGGTGQIRHLSFSRDGQLLAGGAFAAPTIVWDLSVVARTLREMGLKN